MYAFLSKNSFVSPADNLRICIHFVDNISNVLSEGNIVK